MGIEVVHIADRADPAPAVARWMSEEWTRRDGHTLAETISRLGWSAIGGASHHGHEVTVMARDLS
jgi:hypothetical protein